MSRRRDTSDRAYEFTTYDGIVSIAVTGYDPDDASAALVEVKHVADHNGEPTRIAFPLWKLEPILRSLQHDFRIPGR